MRLKFALIMKINFGSKLRTISKDLIAFGMYTNYNREINGINAKRNSTTSTGQKFPIDN